MRYGAALLRRMRISLIIAEKSGIGTVFAGIGSFYAGMFDVFGRMRIAPLNGSSLLEKVSRAIGGRFGGEFIVT